MKKQIYAMALLGLTVTISACNSGQKKTEESGLVAANEYETVIEAAGTTPAYIVVNKPQVNLDDFAKEDDWIVLFDGATFKGWRGYNKDEVPSRWIIEDGAIKFTASGAGEAQDASGGDIIFEHKFKNFELTFDWKVSKGTNSGILYLAQEIKDEPIYISSPEYQILDNANHPDAKLGENGNRQSASLYDMIPAIPQNSKPFGEWNTGSILVYKGTVVHRQNDANVLEYHLWTPQWTELLQKSKFSQEKWPLAFELLNNLGGDAHEGYIGLQDHGDDVWYKNIRIKILD